MCEACHKVKTRRDLKAIWTVKRLNGEVMSQYERRKKFGSQLRGRPFESRMGPPRRAFSDRDDLNPGGP